MVCYIVPEKIFFNLLAKAEFSAYIDPWLLSFRDERRPAFQVGRRVLTCGDEMNTENLNDCLLDIEDAFSNIMRNLSGCENLNREQAIFKLQAVMSICQATGDSVKELRRLLKVMQETEQRHA